MHLAIQNQLGAASSLSAIMPDPTAFDNLELWIDASDTSSITTSGGVVTGVADKSGNSRTITVSGTPEYDSDAWNRGINLDGSTDYFTVDSVADWKFLHDGTGCTIFVVFESASKEPDRFNCLLSTATTGVLTGILLGEDDRSSITFDERFNFTVRNGAAAIISYAPADNEIDTGKKNIYSVRYGVSVSEDDYLIDVDNTQTGAGNDTGTPSTGNPVATLNIGRQASGSNYALGKLTQVIIYSRKLDDAEMGQVYNYINDIETKQRNVVVLIGQSNAEGQGANSQLASGLTGVQAGRYIWNNTNMAVEQLNVGSNNLGLNSSSHGVEPTLMKALHDYYGQDVTLFKYAVGGTSLHTDWNPDSGSNWSAAVTQWNNFRADMSSRHLRPVVKGVIWYQGENDADNSTNANNYQANLTAFKTSVANVFGTAVFIEPKLYVPDDTYPEWEAVNTAKSTVAASDSNHTYIDEWIATIDDVHVTSRSLQWLGYVISDTITGNSRSTYASVATPFYFITSEDQDTCLDSGGNVVDASTNEQIRNMTNKGSGSITTVGNATTAGLAYNTGAIQMSAGYYFEAGTVSDFTEFHDGSPITAFVVTDIITEANGALLSTGDNTPFSAKGVSLFYFDGGPANTYRFFGGTGSLFLCSPTSGSADDYDVSGVDVATLRCDDAGSNDFIVYGKSGAASIAIDKVNTASGDSSHVLHIGAYGSESGGGFYEGNVLAVLIYKQAMTDAQINTIRTYLAERFGTTITDI